MCQESARQVVALTPCCSHTTRCQSTCCGSMTGTAAAAGPRRQRHQGPRSGACGPCAKETQFAAFELEQQVSARGAPFRAPAAGLSWGPHSFLGCPVLFSASWRPSLPLRCCPPSPTSRVSLANKPNLRVRSIGKVERRAPGCGEHRLEELRGERKGATPALGVWSTSGLPSADT